MRRVIRTYSQLRRLETFEERFHYLALGGRVAEETFGAERWLNQDFYRSREWKLVRQEVIARDLGCDLGVEGWDIHGEAIYIHHMNPMTVDEVTHGDDRILDPEFLISCTHRTHNATHYGDERLLPRQLVERRPGDTKLW